MKNLKLAFCSILILFAVAAIEGCKKDDEDETKKEICGNGIDDDGDGFIDLADLDCTETGSECGNGIDDDGDGFIDCLDFDCNGEPNC